MSYNCEVCGRHTYEKLGKVKITIGEEIYSSLICQNCAQEIIGLLDLK